jgi:hypothetical protein
MTLGDDVAHSPDPIEPKWGWLAPPPWPAGQVLAPFQFLLCQRVKEGQCTGYPMPKVDGGQVGKLHSKWEGPYLVLHATDHGTVTLQCDDGDTFKANGQLLKLFLEPNPQDIKEVDVLDFLEIE